MTPSRTRISSMRTHAFAALLFLAVATSAHASATISLKAVAKNGVPITPTNSLEIAPGDVVTADIFVSGWNNPPFDGGQGRIQTMQVTLAGARSALSSGSCAPCNTEYVLPLGWDAPLNTDLCPCDHPCFTICDLSGWTNPLGACRGPDMDRSAMALMTKTRADWIFHGFEEISAVDVSSVNVRWGTTTWGNWGQTASRCSGGSLDGFSCSIPADCPSGFCDPNYSSYVGTLNLKAGSAVCGTYTISFEEATTFIVNDAAYPGFPVTAYPATQGLVLTAGLPCVETWGSCCTGTPYGPLCSRLCEEDCIASNQQFGGIGSECDICGQSLSTSPANCAIDARRPFPPNTSAHREGFNSITWTFLSPPGSGEDSRNDFMLRQVPNTPPDPPVISSVSFEPGNAVTLHFSGPIQPNKWTCIKHFASGFEKCLGFLPGDADGSRTVGVGDILKIIDNLNGPVIPPLTNYQCDIDRSGVCAPADILTEIDLLNGVTGFQVQNGSSLEPCPSAP